MRTIEQNAESTSASRRPIPPYVSGKIQGHHLEKLAVVYVRQSTARQVLEHHESTDLQYKLANRAVALGWAQDRVLVIDDDLGQSGATAGNRVGFQRLLAEIGMNHVGLVLGMEMSRLARCNRDWHQLLELCAVFGVLLADLDGLYDPGHHSDRLLEWREPTPSTLHRILRHPQYAGAYVYGRAPTNPRRKIPGRPGTGKTRVPMEQWLVLRRDALPAYISWEQYLANQERLKQNASQFATLGAPRLLDS